MTDDFLMYKGTTQPINIGVMLASGSPANISSITEAYWSVDEYPQTGTSILTKKYTTEDITVITGDEGESNTLSFSILPDDDDILDVGQYSHEARIVFASGEYVVFPWPPGSVATFTVYSSITRGVEIIPPDTVTRRMPTVKLDATLWGTQTE